MKAPIVSRKHIVQHTEFTVASAGVGILTEAEALAVQNVDAAHEIIEGSIVKAIYIEIWMSSNVTGGASFVAMVEKAPNAVPNISFSGMTTLDAYANKKNILYTTQGLVAGNGDNPTPIIRQWIKIPRGKQRFGLSDKFKVNIAAIGSNALLACGFSVYKSYQ